MAETIVVSICSREKDSSPGLLPARKRYLGSHIRLAECGAEVLGEKFFILSGKYGLLAANELVEYYDYLLEERAVPALAKRVFDQVGTFAFTVERIRYITKRKRAWYPYRRALEAGVQGYKIPVTIEWLEDNA